MNRTGRSTRNRTSTSRSSSSSRSTALSKVLGPGNYRRISREAGFAPQHVARVLRGTRGASFHAAKRIADAAAVSLDDLYMFITNSPELTIRGRKTRADLG